MSADPQFPSNLLFSNANELPAIKAVDWQDLLREPGKRELERVLPIVLNRRRWFGGKARGIASVALVDAVPVPHDQTVSYIVPIKVDYKTGKSDTYILGVSFAAEELGNAVVAQDADAGLARVETSTSRGLLYDAIREKQFCLALLRWIGEQDKIRGAASEIDGVRTAAFERLRGSTADELEPKVMRGEQSNTSVLFDKRLILKIFRRVEDGVNPEFEIGLFLTARNFRSSPAVAGGLEIRNAGGGRGTLAILQAFIPNRGDAWKYTLESLEASLDLVEDDSGATYSTPDKPIFELVNEEPAAEIVEKAGAHLQLARLLGERTAQMHVALCGRDGDPDFGPEPFSPGYQQWLYQNMSNLAEHTMELLRSRLAALSGDERWAAEQLLERKKEVLDEFHAIVELPIQAARIRVHGDYHLGQVLFTGDDFVIIDFEGEPLRPISERRIKRSPLQDVAGMLRSFQYAGYTGVAGRKADPEISPEVFSRLESFVGAWCAWTSAAFLQAYLEAAQGAVFLPGDGLHLEAMLNAYQLEKAVYELAYEINNRPDWVRLPIQGIMQLLDQRSEERRKRLRAA